MSTRRPSPVAPSPVARRPSPVARRPSPSPVICRLSPIPRYPELVTESESE
jgi:hypothetical protein